MALTGERPPWRGNPAEGSVLLRALLIVAIVLVPVLTCPAVQDAATILAAAGPGAVAAPVRFGGVSPVLAAAANTEDHHGCRILPTVTAAITAAASVLQGWSIAPAVMAFAVLGSWATWRLSTRGPPRGQPHWLLSNGRDRLVHFCVMRR